MFVRKLTFVWLILASFLASASVSQAAEPKKPNVLLICVDDLKPLIGAYGDPLAQTPNLDALAKRGVRFDAAFCNQAVCAPSRNSLLTGIRPQSLGIYDLATNFRAARPDAVTLPQAFKDQGYHCQALGKIFHVGHGNHEDPKSWSVPHWKVKSIDYASPESKPEGLTREEALFSNDFSKPIGKLPRGAALEAADVEDNTYADGKLADEAIQRIDALAKTPDAPFFLAVGFVKPHLPFCARKSTGTNSIPPSSSWPSSPNRPKGRRIAHDEMGGVTGLQ
ncbi:MAG: sulfatase-like hydrolase/transferase [Pirellulales bacterium]